MVTSNTLMAAAKVNAGPIVLLGAVIVVIAVLAFAFVTSQRRKKRPTECAEQRAALESAESALHYWEAAVAHLREVDLASANPASVEPAAGASGASAVFKYGHTADMTGEQFAELLKRAVDGRDEAERQRDQCQVDLVNCVGQPATGPRITPYAAEPLRPVLNGDPPPRRFSEDG